ncbi:MAG TPA: outer membrane protein assembly factor BamE [Burkholderiales bacterium]|nr:outer membrane protein assembly factor BamE [Burkholderiales bacterium]
MKLRALALAGLLALAACSRVTQENFAKINMGMTEEQVQAILGSPTESSSKSLLGLSGTSSRWSSGAAVITIGFVNGKVALKNYETAEGK